MIKTHGRPTITEPSLASFGERRVFGVPRPKHNPMREGGGGSIINISSTVGLVGSVNGAPTPHPKLR
ncbi:MAG: hypothetical protein JJE47_13465 [Acidimicrobiia bacterium]|nr:hypothetical protein [Acidimicrobiia bacterium]